MKRSPIKKISQKQRDKNAAWAKVCDDKFEAGTTNCEVCGAIGTRDRMYFSTFKLFLDGHHIDKDRAHNTSDNCLLCCRLCHMHIHANPAESKRLGYLK